MVFVLANGDTWIQRRARRVRIHVGDEVRTKPERLGGSLIVSSEGVSTWVRPRNKR